MRIFFTRTERLQPGTYSHSGVLDDLLEAVPGVEVTEVSYAPRPGEEIEVEVGYHPAPLQISGDASAYQGELVMWRYHSADFGREDLSAHRIGGFGTPWRGSDIAFPDGFRIDGACTANEVLAKLMQAATAQLLLAPGKPLAGASPRRFTLQEG